MIDPAKRTLLEHSASNLRQLTSVGCSGSILVMMANLSLECAHQPRMSEEMAAYVGGPIIVHNSSRTLDDTHPAKTMKSEILAERVEIAFGLSPFIVGPSEICAVLFQYMLETATPDSVSNLYLWAGARALAKQGVGQTVDEINSMLKSPGTGPALTDDQVLHEEPWASAYRALAGEIRGKVLEHMGAKKGSDPGWQMLLSDPVEVSEEV